MIAIKDLRATFARAGRVEWIGLRSGRRLPVWAVPEAEAHPLVGLLGDHGKLAPPRLTALVDDPVGSHDAALARAALTNAASARTAPPSVPGGSGKRQVTLIQAEHLPVIAALAGLDSVTPELLRRNILVSGLSVLALKDRRFQIGNVILEGSGECHPCSRMEENLGPGGYNAVRGHGGVTARVVQGGRLCVGDAVHALPAHS